MKQLYITLLLSITGLIQISAQRYLDSSFAEVTVTSDIEYGQNITIISGAPEPETLLFDFYEPTGDTLAERPLIVYLHTGSFLPIGLNGTTTGAKEDYAAQRFCSEAARRGWTCAVPTYRKGWNPLDTTAELRRRGLINAAYRSVQDLHTFLRFVNRDIAENGNSWRIDNERVALMGQGTGGYISVTAATVDRQEELYIPKFSDPVTGASFLDTALLGNIFGTSDGQINIVNHAGYSSDFHFSMNAGGALGDISWLEDNAVPMIAAHTISNPFAPFGIDFGTGMVIDEGPVIVPTTGEFVVSVAGSKAIIKKANDLGVNDVLNNSDLIQNDPLIQTLNAQQLASPNLWAISQPGIQVAPWEYWDPAIWGNIAHPSCGQVTPPDCSFHTVNLQVNPDMSMTKANNYIDTLIEYFTLNAYVALDLMTVDSRDPVAEVIGLKVFPNPASESMSVTSSDDFPVQNLWLYNGAGQMVREISGIDASRFELNRNGLPPGMYILKVQSSKGLAGQKVFFR